MQHIKVQNQFKSHLLISFSQVSKLALICLSHSFFFCYYINFQRYESEYISHYKQFESRRPNTVKGEVTRSLSYNGVHSNGSTPRAGLLSTQLGSTLEPPLQRKRIVPYEKNHNIFTTLTVKEQHDRDWLKSDENSHRSRSPNRQYKEVECLQYYYNTVFSLQLVSA